MTPTEHIEAKLAGFIDGDLPDADRAEIEAYLDGNPAHRTLIDEMRRQKQVLTQLPRATAPPEVLDHLQGYLERAALLGDAPAPGAMRIGRGRATGEATPGAKERKPAEASGGRAAGGGHGYGHGGGHWGGQWGAIAAVLLLTAGLGSLIYAFLPSAGPGAKAIVLNKSNTPAAKPTPGMVTLDDPLNVADEGRGLSDQSGAVVDHGGVAAADGEAIESAIGRSLEKDDGKTGGGGTGGGTGGIANGNVKDDGPALGGRKFAAVATPDENQTERYGLRLPGESDVPTAGRPRLGAPESPLARPFSSENTRGNDPSSAEATATGQAQHQALKNEALRNQVQRNQALRTAVAVVITTDDPAITSNLVAGYLADQRIIVQRVRPGELADANSPAVMGNGGAGVGGAQPAEAQGEAPDGGAAKQSPGAPGGGGAGAGGLEMGESVAGEPGADGSVSNSARGRDNLTRAAESAGPGPAQPGDAKQKERVQAEAQLNRAGSPLQNQLSQSTQASPELQRLQQAQLVDLLQQVGNQKTPGDDAPTRTGSSPDTAPSPAPSPTNRTARDAASAPAKPGPAWGQPERGADTGVGEQASGKQTREKRSGGSQAAPAGDSSPDGGLRGIQPTPPGAKEHTGPAAGQGNGTASGAGKPDTGASDTGASDKGASDTGSFGVGKSNKVEPAPGLPAFETILVARDVSPVVAELLQQAVDRQRLGRQRARVVTQAPATERVSADAASPAQSKPPTQSPTPPGAPVQRVPRGDNGTAGSASTAPTAGGQTGTMDDAAPGAGTNAAGAAGSPATAPAGANTDIDLNQQSADENIDVVIIVRQAPATRPAGG